MSSLNTASTVASSTAAQHSIFEVQHPIVQLASRFPQLYIPVEEGARSSDLYRSVVLCGENPSDLSLDFSFSDEDKLVCAETPAGPVEVLRVVDRADFEHIVTCLAYYCEPQDFPVSMGAILLDRLNDWGKINTHKRQWLDQGNSLLRWSLEFQAFTASKDNVTSSLIVLSEGPYSGISAETAGYDQDAWIRHSFTIREYHELTHYVCRHLFAENSQTLRDEVLADYAGLVAAFGNYDQRLALTFLGLEGKGVRQDGRLVNYVAQDELLEDAASRARELVALFASFDAGFSNDMHGGSDRCFAAVTEIETRGIGL